MLAFVAAACALSLARADTSETLFFLSDDLSSAAVYFSHRADEAGNYSYLFDRSFDPNRVLYARPENYRWQQTTLRGTDYRQLLFPGVESYAFLKRESDPADFLEPITATSYRVSVDGSRCKLDGCVTDENIVSVVLPKRFKVLKYEGQPSGPRGNWKVVDNTYTFYARRVKGASVVLEIEDRYAGIFNAVNASMSQLQGVEVRNVEGTIRIVMPMDNVFAPGGVTLRAQGAAWVKQLAAAVKGAAVREIRIEGHADASPIKSLQFPSNWELSSARAAQALRVFLAEGLAPAKLMAAGLADSRPLAEGDSAAARAKNRRIEFTIVPALP